MHVVHPHLHRRRTGVTRHVESVVAATPEARVYEHALAGRVLAPSLPHVSLAEARRADVWHAHRNGELMLGLILRLLGARMRLVVTRHSATRPSWITRALARRADRVVSISADVARAIGLPSVVVPHGVELARFAPPANRGAAWAALGLGGSFGVGVVGRVRPAKGQGDLVEAIDTLVKEYEDLRTVLVGPVKPRDQAFANGLAARGARVVGEQRDIVPWLQGLHVVVQASHSEGFGLAALEAMACGACVVSTRVGGADLVIDHGRTGFLYDAGDVPALRAILSKLVGSPSLAAQVGAAAATEVRARFGIEHEARALEAVYRALEPR